MTVYIDQETKKRVNIYYAYKGFSRLDTPEIRAKAGVVEIPDPTPPEDYSPDVYNRQEVDHPPYVVYERKPDAEIALIKQRRINMESLAYLASSDWYAIRLAETGEAIPADVLTARANARASIVHLDE